jgi:hypothetical protein
MVMMLLVRRIATGMSIKKKQKVQIISCNLFIIESFNVSSMTQKNEGMSMAL